MEPLAMLVGRAEPPPDGWQVFSADAGLAGQTGPLRLAVADCRAGLGDLVTLACAIADELVEGVRLRAQAAGRGPSCRKGCSACCGYLVPVSIPEALHLAGEIDRLPEPRRSRTVRKMQAAAEKIIAAGPPAMPEPSPARPDVRAAEGAMAAGDWYSTIDLLCPLLEDDLCTMYPARPIACREYMVASPARFCRGKKPDFVEAIPVPVSLTEALGQLAAELECTEVQALPLPLAPAFARSWKERARRAWPMPMLAQRLLAILRQRLCPAAS